MPLARISGLLAAEPDAFLAAIGEVDAELEVQLNELRQRRSDLAQLPSAERLCIPEEVAEILAWEREIGLSETSVEIERLYPAELAHAQAAEWTGTDDVTVGLLTEMNEYSSPAWRRLYELVGELTRERGYPSF